MDFIHDFSNLMIGSSLCLLGSVFVFEGALSFLGFAVFAPMALGGLGLCLGSIQKLIPSISSGGHHEFQ
jgi:hypothetical protein